LFSFFDAEGNPQAHSLSSLSPLVWPFRGQVADLRRTLVDFVEPAHQRMAPYLKKTYEGHSFPASVLTMLVIPLLLGVFGFLGSAMTLFIVQYGPWSNMRSQERSTGRYAATEPSFGMPVVPTSPMPRRPGSPMGVPNFAASDPMRKAVVGLPKVPGKGAGLTKARAATPPDVVRKPSPLEEVKRDMLSGNYNGAIRILRGLAEKHPNSADLQVQLAIAYARRGDLGLAVTAALRAVQIEPKNPVYRNSLATYLCLGGRYAEALPHAQEAVKQSPSSASEDTLAHAAFGTGHWDQAVRAWDAVLAEKRNYFTSPPINCLEDEARYKEAGQKAAKLLGPTKSTTP